MSIQTQAHSATASGGSATALLGLGALGTVVALGVVLSGLMSEGHSAFGTNNLVPWGLPISTYVFFVLSSTGLTFVASLAMVFGVKSFYPIAKRCIWLAVATLIAGFASLALEIGHPFRLAWALPFSFQFSSPMWWMGVFYTLYLVLLLLKFRCVNAGDWDSPMSRNLGIASFVSVVIAHGTLGSVFGMMAMRPFWFGGFVPVYFLATAALSGAAFITLFVILSYGLDRDRMPADVAALVEGPLPKVFAAVLGVVIVFTLSRTISGLWGNLEGYEVFAHLTGSMLFQFELWIGMVLPFLILLMPNLRSQPGMQLVASALVLLALFIGRFEFVVGGQLVPLFKGQWVHGFAQYTPSLTEWMLVVLAASITLLLFGLGERMFKLADRPSR